MPHVKDIRLDEGTVSKTVSVTARQGSSPSRTTRRDASPLGAGHACKTCLVEFESGMGRMEV